MAKISKKARKIKAESSSEEEYIDSDEELQEAFARGDLKPGLIAEVPVKRKPNEYPNFVAQMKSKLEKIQFRDDWIERLDITAAPIEETEFSQKGVDLKTDDIQREMLFYKQAQTAVVVGLRRLHTLGIPTKRPEDYFAQMAKSDDQMLKVKRYALEKQLGQERSQKIAKLRDLRKYGKKVQVQVGLERSKKKREMMNKLKEFKEGKLKNLDFLDEDDRPKRGEMLDKTKEEVKKRNAKKNQFRGHKAVGKDAKYGFGGKKRGKKRNGSEFKGVNAGANKFGGNTGGKKFGGKTGGKRFGGKGKQGSKKGRKK
ncbi:probable rRNA-processing protein EBP2 [Artemia franciscana]|uniref:rRNA-processing protein EBP2 n=1 Tax=Artemia franciscana TaxID=6661 RepID=A0AA88I8L6_ARTSF|nr:hypothetical protein QYM36_001159 [Artemia franciscana]KAK2724567.1 hypothetical protein QYM36_001159 [Artemia franciscana]KAK2724568.1 hypothetical protein QYM36_001159 [Artemia franciscana]